MSSSLRCAALSWVVLSLASCVISHETGSQIHPSRVDLHGFVSTPGAQITIEARNPKTQHFEPVITFPSASDPSEAMRLGGLALYPWRTRIDWTALPSYTCLVAPSVSCAPTPESSRIELRILSEGDVLGSFPKGGLDCALGELARGASLLAAGTHCLVRPQRALTLEIGGAGCPANFDEQWEQILTRSEVGQYFVARSSTTFELLSSQHTRNTLLVGTQGASSSFRLERRGYFAFDLSVARGKVVGARLRVFANRSVTACGHPGWCPYGSEDDHEIFELREVHTAPEIVLDPPREAHLSIFEDLGDGAFFGQVTLTPESGDEWLDIPLSQAATDSLDRAMETGSWVVGGRVATLDFSDDHTREYLFVDHLLPQFGFPPQLVLTLACKQ